MAVPMIKQEVNKPKVHEERRAEQRFARKMEVRPEIRDIIKRRISEHAPLWKELAKR